MNAPGIDLGTENPLTAYSRPRNQPANGENPQWFSELLLHSSAHPTLDYVAREEASGGADAYTRDYVGVFDPQTNELKVMPARRLTMRANLKSQADKSDESAEEESQKTVRTFYILPALLTVCLDL